jgi:hypothetical protein
MICRALYIFFSDYRSWQNNVKAAQEQVLWPAKISREIVDTGAM